MGCKYEWNDTKFKNVIFILFLKKYYDDNVLLEEVKNATNDYNFYIIVFIFIQLQWF